MLTSADAHDLEACLVAGGVTVFPTDTVYGIGCHPDACAAVERLYALKGRPAERPAAVMFFSAAVALEALPELRERERAALRALLPGPLTLLLPNRGHRFPLACGPDPDTLGVRVPLLQGRLTALRGVRVPIMQSSANISGEGEARRLVDVPAALRDGADLVLDGGELPGRASTVVDLRAYADRGEWRIVRAGPMQAEELKRALDGPDPC
jgi:L-threonylcarbamoyladenylate synthase